MNEPLTGGLPAILLPLGVAALLSCGSDPLGTCNEAFPSTAVWKSSVTQKECREQCPPYRYSTVTFYDLQTVTTYHINECTWVPDPVAGSLLGPV